MPVTVEIYTMAGDRIVSDQFTGRYSVDLSANARGLYVIYMKSADQMQVEKLILK
jgi:hypothetical protein